MTDDTLLGSETTSGDGGCTAPDEVARATGARVGQRRVRAGRDRSRGQTTIDFAVGVTIFVAVITLVFTLVPGALAPFTGSGQEETVAVNRVADQVAEGALVTSGEPYILNGTCTREFFANDTGPGYCPYSGDTLTERVGLLPRDNVNVTLLEMDGDATEDALCWDDAASAVTSTTDADCTPGSNDDVVYRIGPTPPRERGAVVTARRSVSVDGRAAVLLIKMW